MSSLARKSVRESLALQLIILREKYKDNHIPGSDVEISISREDLANMVGTARENVIRILGEFKESGILVTAGRTIIVKDLPGLIKLSGS
jgi:CRP-like cAMP-binding protein